ncbi:MAG: hypothetical protein IJW67_12550 [Blautia sp.]|nr:hypothetical protein [Blautia sp.]
MKTIKSVFAKLTGKKEVKDRETLRKEYEASVSAYDHYNAYGSAFANFCSKK